MRYRIVHRSGFFIAQMWVPLFWFFGWWEDLFCGSVSDLPDEFSNVEEARKKIVETHRQRQIRGPVHGVACEFELPD